MAGAFLLGAISASVIIVIVSYIACIGDDENDKQR